MVKKGSSRSVAASGSRQRGLPAVHVVLRCANELGLITRHGRDVVVTAVRAMMDEHRARLRDDHAGPAPSAAEVVREVAARLDAGSRPVLAPAVNATGIILHTGLGRAPMPETARAAVAAMGGYGNLQLDLESGERLEREHIIRDLVTDLTGAEDVLLVNNNAAATVLALRALAHEREVVVSRGELIEIGGSFRLPEIMAESGALLREVGTTNKTHRRDYEQALGVSTAMLLKVHKSNYDIVGFTHEVLIGELAALGREKGIPVLDDLGCGAMVGLERFGLGHETTLPESIAAGSDLVLSSTDKLIGGPQGGLIVGRRALIARLRAHPLYRALRVCKLTYAALEATLRLFKMPDQLERTHPVYAMLAKRPAEIERQARLLAEQARAALPAWGVSVEPQQSFLGGGSLPGQHLPSQAVCIRPRGMDAAELARRLRQAATAVVGRVHQDALCLDMRTVGVTELPVVLDALRAAGTGGAAT
ncbi:MAG: L-seryl-tRNA(Sec) selenium transferase [Kiritimatiellae bacterium]|nr:L-seryl-tRNA(Sec) selenium transferase [Kiritimatiellia bacterium]